MPQVSMFRVAAIPTHSSLGLINVSKDHPYALMAGLTQVVSVTTSTTLPVKPKGSTFTVFSLGGRSHVKRAFPCEYPRRAIQEEVFCREFSFYLASSLAYGVDPRFSNLGKHQNLPEAC